MSTQKAQKSGEKVEVSGIRSALVFTANRLPLCIAVSSDGCFCNSRANANVLGDKQWPSCRTHLRALEAFLIANPATAPPERRPPNKGGRPKGLGRRSGRRSAASEAMATAAAAAAQDEEPADAAEQSEAMATAAAAENAVEPLEATEATSTAEDHDEEMSMTSWIRQGM